MLPNTRKEAELVLPDADVSLITSWWPDRLDYTFSAPRHLIAMYLANPARAEGRYCEWDEDFAPVGALFFRPARLHLEIRGEGGHQARAIHCMIDDRRLQALAPAALDCNAEQVQAALDLRSAGLQFYFRRLLAELRTPGFASATVADAALVLMISELSDQLVPGGTNEGADWMPDQRLRRVRERVDDLSTPSPTVGELAALAGVSERHLLRLFRARGGTSLVEFLRKARLQKATRLLTDTDLALKEIAHQLGFSSHASFATAFRRDTGAAPSAFRREHRRTYAVRSTSAGRNSVAWEKKSATFDDGSRG